MKSEESDFELVTHTFPGTFDVIVKAWMWNQITELCVGVLLVLFICDVPKIHTLSHLITHFFLPGFEKPAMEFWTIFYSALKQMIISAD